MVIPGNTVRLYCKEEGMICPLYGLLSVRGIQSHGTARRKAAEVIQDILRAWSDAVTADMLNRETLRKRLLSFSQCDFTPLEF